MEWQVLYIDSKGIHKGSPYKELAPIELRLVPFYCDISPEAQKIVDSRESYTQKLLRQTTFGVDCPTFKYVISDNEWSIMGRSYSAHFLPFNPEIRISAFMGYQKLIVDWMCNNQGWDLDDVIRQNPISVSVGNVKLVKVK